MSETQLVQPEGLNETKKDTRDALRELKRDLLGSAKLDNGFKRERRETAKEVKALETKMADLIAEGKISPQSKVKEFPLAIDLYRNGETVIAYSSGIGSSLSPLNYLSSDGGETFSVMTTAPQVQTGFDRLASISIDGIAYEREKSAHAVIVLP